MRVETSHWVGREGDGGIRGGGASGGSEGVGGHDRSPLSSANPMTGLHFLKKEIERLLDIRGRERA